MASTHTQHQRHAGGSQASGASAQNQGQSGKTTGGSPIENVKDAARQTGEQLKEQAQSAAETLRQQGEGFFAEQKGKAASELTTLSSAIRGAADKLRGDDESHAARYAEMAADKLDNVAQFVGKQNVGSLVREIERAARRRPELFLGGMFLMGLGISRFLKASSPGDSSPGRPARSQDWRSQRSH
jgi:hypothetical protein